MKKEETEKNEEKKEINGEMSEQMTESQDENQKEDELIEKIKELEEKVIDYEILAKRKVADFDNFRKRVTQEKNQLREIMADKVILDFLPILDNLERALDAAKNNSDFESLLDGINSIAGIFNSVLDKYSVKKVDSINQDFDPKIHHALYTVEGDYEKQTVIQEVENAYSRNERILRVAKVAVGIPKKTKESNNSDQEKINEEVE